nr:CvpA family protein [uncultured Noviherbaspirillum sp.]
MTLFDYLTLFVLVASIIISTSRGVVREVLSLASWVAAFMVANLYGETLAQLLPDMVPGALTRLIIAFVLLFIGTRLLMGLLILMCESLIKASGLSFVDRSLGSVFGLARGMLIVLVTVILCGMTAIPQQPFWKDAMLSPYAESAARSVKPFLPDEFARHVQF